MRSAIAVFLTVSSLFADSRNQVYEDFRAPQPLPAGHTLVLGIVGGWERWDQTNRGVGRLAAALRARAMPGVHVETVENHKLPLGRRLIRAAFDRDRDGSLSADEASQARLILYGQSLGGKAVLTLARECESLGIPVKLAVVIDAVGLRDARVPANVAAAVNYFQRESWPVVGAKQITAADPARTRILGNFRQSYRGRKIDMPPEETWLRKTFMGAHLKLEYDHALWAEIEERIAAALQ